MPSGKGACCACCSSYYGARVLSFFDRISGLLALIAAIFTITWFQRTNELTAVMAAGISKARIIRPLVVATVDRGPAGGRQSRGRLAAGPRQVEPQCPGLAGGNRQAAHTAARQSDPYPDHGQGHRGRPSADPAAELSAAQRRWLNSGDNWSHARPPTNSATEQHAGRVPAGRSHAAGQSGGDPVRRAGWQARDPQPEGPCVAEARRVLRGQRDHVRTSGGRRGLVPILVHAAAHRGAAQPESRLRSRHAGDAPSPVRPTGAGRHAAVPGHAAGPVARAIATSLWRPANACCWWRPSSSSCWAARRLGNTILVSPALAAWLPMLIFLPLAYVAAIRRWE